MFQYQSGDVIAGAYRVVRRLGKGGVGDVYEVEHSNLGVHYALKTFTLSKGRIELLRKRFLAEGKVLARLRQPNLVRAFDLGFDEKTGTPYFVMDLILDGKGRSRTLDDIRPGEVSEERLKRWFVQLCAVLDYVHEKGVVHRDIKPSNILIDEHDGVVLTDFGVSRFLSDELRRDLSLTTRIISGKIFTSTMHIRMGTEAFMAPEVKKGKQATAASDAYSLGLVFFYLLTGIWYSERESSFDLLDAFDGKWKLVLSWLLRANPGFRPVRLMLAADDLLAESAKPLFLPPPSPPPKPSPPPLSFEDVCVGVVVWLLRRRHFVVRVMARVKARLKGPLRIKLPRSSRFEGGKKKFVRYSPRNKVGGPYFVSTTRKNHV